MYHSYSKLQAPNIKKTNHRKGYDFYYRAVYSHYLSLLNRHQTVALCEEQNKI